MKYLIAFLLNLIPLAVLAQGEGNHLIRDGNKLYDTGNFEEASSKYDEALNKDQNSFEGGFNLGDSYYRQEKYEEAEDCGEGIERCIGYGYDHIEGITR